MPQTQTIEPLPDEEIKAIADDPALVAKLTSDERRRLSSLTEPAGTWEDRGIAGKVWHPSTVPQLGFQRDAAAPSERSREDNSLFGFPPELAALSGVGVVRAVSGAGIGLASKAAAGAKTLVEQAHPIVKYEVTKSLLQRMGVPSEAATVAAMAVSDYRMRSATGTAPAAEQTAAQGIDEAVAAGRLRRAADTPVRRARLDTSQMNAQPTPADLPPEFAPVDAPSAVAARTTPPPVDPHEALLQKLGGRGADVPGSTPAPTGPESPPTRAAGRARQQNQARGSSSRRSRAASPSADQIVLTPAEEAQAATWHAQGVPVETIAARILTSRTLTQRLGTATPEEVAKALAHRDVTGKW